MDVTEAGVGAGVLLMRADVDSDRVGRGVVADVERPLVVVGELAQAGVRRTEAVQRPGLTRAVAELAVQGQRLLQVGRGPGPGRPRRSPLGGAGVVG
ncbi:hypothetical protein [Micromonospora schwarzwaldensis]|uniref:hypothetical protein n=1 Tax=Micromonospora sp. DSM 45708 TaxID=3111767 RepID=UPI0031D8C0B8